MRSAIKSAHSFDVRALPEPGVERLSDRQVNGNFTGSCPQDIVRERGDKSARGRNRVIWREMKILSRCDFRILNLLPLQTRSSPALGHTGFKRGEAI